MPKTKVKPPVERVHKVARTLIYNGQQYLAESPITFGVDMTDEQIEELVEDGTLAGPRAEELDDLRKFSEKVTGTHGPSLDETAKLWQQFNRLTPEQRIASEKRESRIKEDSLGAKLANIDDARAEADADEEE